MFWLKEFFVFALSIVTLLICLWAITNSSRSYNHNQNFDSSKKSESNSVTKLSEDFYYYLDLIQNKPIDKNKIENKLVSLDSGFEREFLHALLKKRSGDFGNAFNHLFALLENFPEYSNYYEELSLLGKVSGNSKKLSEWLEKNNSYSSNKFYYYLKGLIAFHNGNTSQAIEIFQSLISDNFISKEIYFQLANAYRITGNYDEALKNLISAENLSKKNDLFLPKIINLKGTIFFLSGDYEQAKKSYTSALESSVNSGNKSEEIKSFANLAIIKDVYGDIYKARDDFESAITMAEEIENIELLAFLYSELGVSFTYTNSLIEARKNYEKSFSLYEKLKDNERLSYLSSNIGSLYLQIANYKSALDYYSRGLQFAGENKLGQILNLTGLADVYSNESNYSKALQYYNRAKEIADSIKDISSSLKIEQGIGALYYNINRPFEALEILKNTDSNIKNDESPFEMVKLYSKIGTVLTSIDSLNQAQIYFQKGLSVANKIGDIYSSIVLKTELAYNYFQQKNYSEAFSLLSEAQTSAKKYNLTQLLGLQKLYLGKIFNVQNNFDKAIENYQSAFQLSGNTHDYNNQIEAAYLVGKSFEENNDHINAEKWYLIAIELIEKISSPLSPNQEIQIAHFSGWNSIYNSLAELFLEQRREEEAFLVIDKARSRNTKSNLDRLKLLSYLKDESVFTEMIDLEWMISSGLYDQAITDSLKAVVSKIKSQLISENKHFEEIFTQKKPETIEDMKEKLGDNDNILSVYVRNTSSALFNLNSNGLSYEKLSIGRDSLLSMLKSISPIYHSHIWSEEIYVNEDLFSFNALAAFQLYERVFKNFLSGIPSKSNLIISFPSELMMLPVEMLITEWNDGDSPYYYSDKKFLLDDFQISYTPSAAIYFIQKDKSENNNNQNLLIGDPYVDNKEFPVSVRSGLIEINPSQSRNILLYPLKYSMDEIESIDELISNTKVFISREATENNFNQYAASSNVIHISSHSFLVKDQPLIIFSPQPDDSEDGFLELGEIIQLNLNSDLVVLSSCRSGLGRVDAAEGIIGMQKAFFDAGSKSVVVSLWDVNDKYTSYFMKDFYKHLSDGKSKTEALKQTKIDFIKKYSANPYYWSAFVLSGNPSSIKLEQSSSFGILNLLLLLILITGLYYIIRRIRLKKL